MEPIGMEFKTFRDFNKTINFHNALQTLRFESMHSRLCLLSITAVLLRRDLGIM